MPRGSLNEVKIIGNLGSKPEKRYTTSGQPVANFSVATNEGYFNNNDSWVERTEWHKCVAWGERLMDEIKNWDKGDKVYVTGRILTNKWQDNDGVDRYTPEVNVRDAWTINAKPKEEGVDTPELEEKAMEPVEEQELKKSVIPDDDDDVPF